MQLTVLGLPVAKILGLRFGIEMPVICCVKWMNQSFVAVGRFFKFADVHGKYRDVWEHIIKAFNYFLGKVCFLLATSAFHDVSENVNKILFIFS